MKEKRCGGEGKGVDKGKGIEEKRGKEEERHVTGGGGTTQDIKFIMY